MTISSIDQQAQSAGQAAEAPSQSGGFEQPTQSDADFFSAALEQAESPAVKGSLAETMMNPLAQRATSLKDLSKSAAQALRDATKGDDPMRFLNASKAVSDYYLQTSLSVKLVSKGSQALDKLTNMQ